MTQPNEPLAPHLAEPSKLGQEISLTGKWIPKKQGGRFRKSAESKEMLEEWEDIHAGARERRGSAVYGKSTTPLARTPYLFTMFSKTPMLWFTIFRRQRHSTWVPSTRSPRHN